REGAGDGGHFEGVGKPRAVIVPQIAGKDLRLVAQPAEGGAVGNAVAVALEWRTVGMERFGARTTRRGAARHGPGGQQGLLSLVDGEIERHAHAGVVSIHSEGVSADSSADSSG